jgi:hypothetical protein
MRAFNFFLNRVLSFARQIHFCRVIFLYVSILYARFLYIFCQNFAYSASKPLPPSQTFGTCHYFMRGFNVLLVRILCISRQKLFRRVITFVACQFDFRHGIRFWRRFSCATVNNFAGFYYFFLNISFFYNFLFSKLNRLFAYFHQSLEIYTYILYQFGCLRI